METLSPTRELARLILHVRPGLGSGGRYPWVSEPTHCLHANEVGPPCLFCSALARTAYVTSLPVTLPDSLIPGGALSKAGLFVPKK